MPLKFDARDFDAALRQFKQTKPEPAPVQAAVAKRPSVVRPGVVVTPEQELKLRVIASRAKLKVMRDRSEALRDSLQRFRSQNRTVING
jgi:type II secretory pathway component PulC